MSFRVTFYKADISIKWTLFFGTNSVRCIEIPLYKVTLPDHDFPIGEKLITSVYAACLKKDGEVSYNGPTFIPSVVENVAKVAR